MAVNISGWGGEGATRERGAVRMSATDAPASGMADQTFIYDFLPIYLFPHGERVIEEWMPCGLSLGGEWGLAPRYGRVTC